MLDEIKRDLVAQQAYGLPIENTWSCPNGFGSHELPPEDGLPPELGRVAYTEHFLRPGMELFVYEAQLASPLTIASGIMTEEPYFWLPIGLSGGGCFRHGSRLSGEGSAEKTYLGLIREPWTEFDHWTGQTIASVDLLLTASRLRDMLNGQRAPDMIATFMDGRLDPVAIPMPITPTMRRIADQIKSNPYQGPMASVYLEGKAFELLADILNLLGDATELASPTLRARRQAFAARDIMMADLANPPRIENVARQVGLSQRSLNELFRELFGAPPLQCLTQWRLEEARSLLARSDLMVKQVAYIMGYAHVSSFSQAYARHFGEPPSRRAAKLTSDGPGGQEPLHDFAP